MVYYNYRLTGMHMTLDHLEKKWTRAVAFDFSFQFHERTFVRL